MSLDEYVQFYRKQHLSMIPVSYGRKEATIKWAPYQERLPTDAELRQWFSKNNTNIAVICGQISGNLVSLDCDSMELFHELATKITERVGKPLADFTRISLTGRGAQILFKTKEPVKSMKFPKLDIKGEGGYIIVPPSIHPNGKQYKFLNENVPIRTIDNLKDIGIDIDQKPESPRSSQPNWVTQALQGVSEGQRNDTCLRLAGHFKNSQPQDITEQLLLDWNSRNKTPLPEREILATIKSAYSYEPRGHPSDSKLRSLSSIINSPVSLPIGLWDNFLFPQAIVFFSGETGAGKTTFMYNLAGALSCGDDFLGFKVFRPLSVLIYDLESPDGLIKSRSTLLDKLNPENIKLGQFNNFRDDYKRIVEESNGFDVSIIDTVSAAFKTNSEDDNAEAREEIKLARRYVNETGACLILVHHMGKFTQGKGVYKARGASARPDLSDVVINFESISEDVIRFEQPKNRFIGGNFTMFLKKLEGQFEVTKFQGYADTMETFKAQQAITELLTKNIEMPRKDIVSTLETQGFASATIDRALTPLLQEGKIFKPRFGYYKLKGTLGF